MFNKQSLAVAAAVALVCALMAGPASAQIVGGGAGQLSGLLAWVMTNIVRVAVSAGVIGIAIALLLFRFNFATVAMVAVGGLIAANYATIGGFFGF